MKKLVIVAFVLCLITSKLQAGGCGEAATPPGPWGGCGSDPLLEECRTCPNCTTVDNPNSLCYCPQPEGASQIPNCEAECNYHVYQGLDEFGEPHWECYGWCPAWTTGTCS